MQSPDLKNCDFFYDNSVQKRKGKIAFGDKVNAASEYFEQLTQNKDQVTSSASSVLAATCYKFVAPSSKSMASGLTKIGVIVQGLFTELKFTIRVDAAGDPGAIVTNGTSNSLTDFSGFSGSQVVQLSFPIPPALVGATTYWFCIEMSSPGPAVTGWTTRRDSTFTTATDVKTTFNNYATIGNDGAQGRGFFSLQASTPPVQGLYDFRREETDGTVTQNILAAADGEIRFKDDPSISTGPWTSIATGLADAQDKLYDFISLKGLVFACDHATNQNRVWDGASSGMMFHGYRMSPGYLTGGKSVAIAGFAVNTITVADTNGVFDGQTVYLKGGAAGTVEFEVSSFVASTSITLTETPVGDETLVEWNGQTLAEIAGTGTLTADVYKILAVTRLKSGGFRASYASSILMTGGASKDITVSGIEMNSSADGTEFAFDISPAATTWFMTDGTTTGDTAGIFFKIPPANIDLALNPMANIETTFDITGITTAILNASDTLLAIYNLSQNYFTLQIDTPKAKYFSQKPFQNFIPMAGDPLHPSRINFSQLLAPQIWSSFGQTFGEFLEVSPNDGEIITGLWVWQRRLFVFKTKSAYVITFTGNNLQPFTLDRLQGNIGCLSHWSLQEIPAGMVMISQQGPAICYGSYMAMLPAGKDILNKFNANDPDRYNLGAMQFSTSLNNESKFQIWWGVSTTNSTIRDQVLMFDYEKNFLWPNDGIAGNYFANIVDVNGSPRPFSGNYNAQVFEHDSGANDDGSAIDWFYSTPDISYGNVGEQELGRWLYISGEVQSVGTLQVDEYRDFETTPSATYTFDMTDAAFKKGLSRPLAGQYEYVRFILKNSELDVPVKVESMRIDQSPLGAQK